MDGPLFFQNSPSNLLRGVRASVALDHVDVLDVHALLFRLGPEDHAVHRPPVPTGDHPNDITLVNAERTSHYKTSGASETIFKNFFSRSSRATGPKTRVPTGSPASLISTAAFWSNRMYVPSRRRCSLRVRTITALTTLPFCT